MSEDTKKLYEELSSSPELVQIHSSLFRMLGYINRGFSPTDTWKGIIAESVSFPQFKTLMVIRYLGQCSIKRLAKTQGISPASASEMTDRLVEMGLVTREPDPADRRRVRINLTDIALKGIMRHEKRTAGKMKELMVEIGPHYARMWVEVSEQLNQVLEKKFI